MCQVLFQMLESKRHRGCLLLWKLLLADTQGELAGSGVEET